MDRSKAIAIKRFFARSIDYVWFTLLVEFLVSPVGVSEELAIYLGWVVFIPVEGLMIAHWGATPGKALLGLKVQTENGEPIGTKRSMVRSGYVWIYGLWLGIPILSIMAGVLAYRDCAESGNTIWDRKTRTVVG